MKVKRFVKEFVPIEIKEPYKPDVLEFNDLTDFNRYYREHEDEFKDMSTYKLNVKYKIPGYKISMKGKRQSDTPEMILIKDYSIKEPQHSTNTVDLSRILQKLDELDKRIASIENYLSSDT